jgi:hypothetical protein
LELSSDLTLATDVVGSSSFGGEALKQRQVLKVLGQKRRKMDLSKQHRFLPPLPPKEGTNYHGLTYRTLVKSFEIEKSFS